MTKELDVTEVNFVKKNSAVVMTVETNAGNA